MSIDDAAPRRPPGQNGDASLAEPLLINRNNNINSNSSNGNNSNNQNNNSGSNPRSLNSSRTQTKLVNFLYITCMCAIGFTSNLLVSLIAPFMPRHCAELNIDVVWVGIIFAVFPFAILT